jgi:SAM-dependent methyltransferase
MSNKKAFKDGEANQWFTRNIRALEKNDGNEPISLLCNWLQPFKKNINNVLEIGCGSAHKLNSLCKSLDSVGYGVEPSMEAVRYINATSPELTVKGGFGDDVPFGETFDLVHLGFYLYLVDRDKYLSCIKEADRLVRPGGFLSIIDFDTHIGIQIHTHIKKG